MSGHSKWSQIKHKKALTDQKRGKLFSKLARQISVVAREKGSDSNASPALRMAIDRARVFNMPMENIERAIARGTGEIEGVRIENFTMEAYGPGGSALVIEGTTDNKNRTVSEIRFLLSERGGKMADPGSVLWLFEHVGLINAKKSAGQDKETLELGIIETDALDFKWLDENDLEIYTAPEALEKTKKALEGQNIAVEADSLGWRPKNEMALPDEKAKQQFEKLMETLDEHDDVNEIYSNID